MSEPLPTLDYARAPRKRYRRTIIGWTVFIGLAIFIFAILQQNNTHITSAIALSQLDSSIKRNNIASITISGDEVSGSFKWPELIGGVNVSHFTCTLPSNLSGNWNFLQTLIATGAEVRVDRNQNLLMDLLLPLVPWLLIFGFVWFFVFRSLRKKQYLIAPVMPVAPSQGT